LSTVFTGQSGGSSPGVRQCRQRGRDDRSRVSVLPLRSLPAPEFGESGGPGSQGGGPACTGRILHLRRGIQKAGKAFQVSPPYSEFFWIVPSRPSDIPCRSLKGRCGDSGVTKNRINSEPAEDHRRRSHRPKAVEDAGRGEEPLTALHLRSTERRSLPQPGPRRPGRRPRPRRPSTGDVRKAIELWTKAGELKGASFRTLALEGSRRRATKAPTR